MQSSLLTFTLLPLLASAHFKLSHPESAHFEDSTEDQGPCGGADLKFPSSDDDLFEYHVGGESISTLGTHESSNWLYRVTTDKKAEDDWEQIFPIFKQSGVGKFCQPKVTVPESYIGKTGILGIVSEATDGLLYQCSFVKFVKGTGEEYDGCSNGTAKGYLVDSEKLTSLLGNQSDSSDKSGKDDGKDKDESKEGDDKDEDGAAMSLKAWGWMSSLLTVGAMAAAGGALLA